MGVEMRIKACHVCDTFTLLPRYCPQIYLNFWRYCPEWIIKRFFNNKSDLEPNKNFGLGKFSAFLVMTGVIQLSSLNILFSYDHLFVKKTNLKSSKLTFRPYKKYYFSFFRFFSTNN
jgi:hypothetical protein